MGCLEGTGKSIFAVTVDVGGFGYSKSDHDVLTKVLQEVVKIVTQKVLKDNTSEGIILQKVDIKLIDSTHNQSYGH